MPARNDTSSPAFAPGVHITGLAALREAFGQMRGTRLVRAMLEEWPAGGEAESALPEQTFLALLAEMTVFRALSGKSLAALGPDGLAAIAGGEAFRALGIENFAENGFFCWPGRCRDKSALAEALTDMAGEIERLLGVLAPQKLLAELFGRFAPDMARAAPDWLCEGVLDSLGPLSALPAILDPACGSGGFLAAAARRLAAEKPDFSAADISGRLHGLDTRPLAALRTKAELLLELQPRMKDVKRHATIRLNVFLADALFIPQDDARSMWNSYPFRIGEERLRLPDSVLASPGAFSLFLDAVRALCKGNLDSGESALARLPDRLARQAAVETGEALYKSGDAAGFLAWLVANRFYPLAFRHGFDLIVGSPRAESADPAMLRALARRCGCLTEKGKPRADMVFLGHCLDYFARPGARLAMLLPADIFTAAACAPLRDGSMRRLLPQEIRPAGDGCLLLALRGKQRETARESLPLGPRIAGSGPECENGAPAGPGECAADSASGKVFLVELGGQKVWMRRQLAASGLAPYRDAFKNGAGIAPCFVRAEKNADGLWHVRPEKEFAEEITEFAEAPEAILPGAFMFVSAQAADIVPFALRSTRLAALPVEASADSALLRDVSELREPAAGWFTRLAALWAKEGKDGAFPSGLDAGGRLGAQNFKARYLVLYGKNGLACSLDTTAYELPFVAEQSTWFFQARTREEADYLAAFLNSDTARRLCDACRPDGAREPGKRILSLPLPAYDGKKAAQRALAELGAIAAARAATFLGPEDEDDGLPPAVLRKALRNELATELAEMDRLLEKLLCR